METKIIPDSKKRFPITQFVLSKNKVFWVFLIFCFIIGIQSYRDIPKEWAPDITIPLLYVVTPLNGASPIDSETLITRQMENEMSGIRGLHRLTSTSSDGVSLVLLEFESGYDLKEAKNDVRDAIGRVTPVLPLDAGETSIIEINFSEIPVYVFNVIGSLSQDDLSQVTDDIKTEIERVSGVLSVTKTGGVEKEMQVYIDPNKLKFYNISTQQIVNSISQENTTIPAGTIDVGSIKIPVRLPGEFLSADSLRRIIVSSNNEKPIYLSDVSTVIRFDNKEQATIARIEGKETISISVSKKAGENLQDVVAGTKEVLDSWKAKYGDLIDFRVLSDQNIEVQRQIDDILNNLIIGFIFVVLVLMLVMGIFNASMVAIVIPLTLLISISFFQLIGVTLNFVVLFSLVMSLGLVVDDAIVIVENIYRHYQMGRSRLDAVRIGVYEVASPVIVSTLTTFAAFFPMIFIPGLMGEFIRFLPYTLITTIFASTIVALIFNPLICSTMMKKPKKVIKEAFNDESISVKNNKLLIRYGKILEWGLNNSYKVIFSMVLLFFGMMYLYFGVLQPGVELFPNQEPVQANINISAPYGSNLAESNRITHQVEEIIEPYREYVDSILVRVGQSTESTTGDTSFYSYITLNFPGWETRIKKGSEIIKEITADFAKPENKIPGAQITIGSADSGPPTGPAVAIEISGDDLLILKELSNQVMDLIENTPNLVNLEDDLILNQNNITIVPNRNVMAKYNISSREMGTAIRTAISGNVASTYKYGKDEFDIVVRYPAEIRNSIENIRQIPIINEYGTFPLYTLASIEIGISPGSIRHITQNRAVTVSGDALGDTGVNVLANIKETLADFELPEGYNLNYGGEDELQAELSSYMSRAFLITIVMIFLLMAMEFNSLTSPFIILGTVFLSLLGVFVGLSVHNAPLSILIGGIGIISLAGIVVKNGIVLIDYIIGKRSQGLELRDAIILSAKLRVRPIILTATTSILGLSPIILGMDVNFFRWPNIISFESEAGDMWWPLANAIIYGLAISTILTLIFIPCLYYVIERKSKRVSLKKRVFGLFGK